MLQLPAQTIQIHQNQSIQHDLLTIEAGQAIGLIGANGSGKTSFLHAMYQSAPSDVVIEFVRFDLPPPRLASHLKKQVMERWNLPKRAYTTYSGGEQLRYQIGAALMKESDLYLLDEPTNHLDEEAVEWLIEMIQQSRAAWIIVSHDRHFLDHIATHIWAIEDEHIHTFRGNYTAYEQERERKRQQQQKRFEEQQQMIQDTERKMKALHDWSEHIHRESTASHHPKQMGAKEYYRTKAKRADRQVKSKEKQLQRLRIEEPIERPSPNRTIQFEIEDSAQRGMQVGYMRDVTLERSGIQVLQNIHFQLTRGEKVALVGPNGSGKSTLLLALLGELPISSGTLWMSPHLKIGYLAQSITFEDEQLRVSDLLEGSAHLMVKRQQQLFHLGFAPERWTSMLKDLSMGERLKVKLLQWMSEGCHLLLLDEPTNHLDLPSKIQLEHALIQYNGTVVFTSHDATFREHVATRTFDMQNDQRPKSPNTAIRDTLMNLENEQIILIHQLTEAKIGSEDYQQLDAQFQHIQKKIQTLRMKLK